MKDLKISLKRAVNCWETIRKAEKGTKFYNKSQKFFQENHFYYEERWNLDTELAYLILIRLVQFRNNGAKTGFPWNFYREDESEFTSAKRWRTQIDKMIRGFYLYLVLDFSNKKEKRIIKKGMQLFIDNFQSLWD